MSKLNIYIAIHLVGVKNEKHRSSPIPPLCVLGNSSGQQMFSKTHYQSTLFAEHHVISPSQGADKSRFPRNDCVHSTLTFCFYFLSLSSQ